MYGIELAMIGAVCSMAEAYRDAEEHKMIMQSPINIRGDLMRARDARKENERLERREREMHDQLCKSIEKAGDNARPRGWEFY